MPHHPEPQQRNEGLWEPCRWMQRVCTEPLGVGTAFGWGNKGLGPRVARSGQPTQCSRSQVQAFSCPGRASPGSQHLWGKS